MLQFMLDTDICIYVIKRKTEQLRERFNAHAEELCISTVTLGELYYGAEKSLQRMANLTTIEHFVSRLEVLPFNRRRLRTMANYGRNSNAPGLPADRMTCKSADTPEAKA